MPNIISSKYREIDYRSLPKHQKFLGYRFQKDGKTAGDKRCDYCGKWFSWEASQMERYILDRRWNFQMKEPIHCGNSLCWDYHMRYLKHVQKMKSDPQYVENNFVERKRREGMDSNKAFNLFQRLKERGLAA